MFPSVALLQGTEYSPFGLSSLPQPPYTIMDRPSRHVVAALASHRRCVRVLWNDGVAETVDLEGLLLEHRRYLRLRRSDALFRTVRASDAGQYLEWSDGTRIAVSAIADLSAAVLTNEQFRIAMKTLEISLEGLAARLGVSRAQISAYRASKPIPKNIALAVRHLLYLGARGK